MSRIHPRSSFDYRSGGSRFTIGPVTSIAVVAVATLLGACGDQPGSLGPSAIPDAPVYAKGGNGSGGGGGALPPRIAFMSGQAAAYSGSIRTMNSDGTGIMNVTFGQTDGSPAWSPDYRKLAFVRAENNTSNIYVVSASGGQPKLLTHGYTPRWSPDGTKIAFARFGGAGYGGIFVMSASGKNITQLTTAQLGSDFYPSWSPDMTKLTFVSNRTGTHEIFVASVDGTSEYRVTACDMDGTQCSAPSWSPVSGDDRIVYYVAGTLLDHPYSGVRVTDANFAAPITVATGKNFGRPAWSPDGSRIVFSKEVTPGNSEIFTVDINGTGLQQLTNNFLFDADVAWAR